MLKGVAIFTLTSCLLLSMQQQAYAKSMHIYQAKEQDSNIPGHTNRVLQVTPYVWATGLKGDISPFKRAPTVTVKKSFGEIIEELNLGGFINLWSRYDNFVFSSDIMYINATDGQTIGPVPPPPVPIPPGIFLNGSVDTQQFMMTFQGGYRVYDVQNFTLDALAGAQFWRISNEVTVSAGSISRSYREHFSWVDPVVGLRGFMRMMDKLSLQAQANIGGFSVGSDFTWSALATINYLATDSMALSAGYKIMDIDYSDSGHVYDVRLNGPVLSMTWRF